MTGIAGLWLTVEPMLRAAIAKGETTVDMLQCLYNGEARLWAILEAGTPIGAVVTQIVDEADGRKVCNIWATAGKDIHRWFHFLATIEAWARDEGCAAVTVDHGRPGWQRMMPNYKVTSVSLEKEL